MERWAGKVAVVTGASSGIGNAIARELVKNGMKVAALARRTTRLEELEKDLHQIGCIKGLKCDVSKLDEIKEAIKWVETNWGEINVLVNNAGINIMEPLTSGTGEGITKVIETNVLGLVACTREVVAVMKRHNVTQGHIININSVVGHYNPNYTGICPYVTSKHSVSIITEALKNELAREKSTIRVTSLSPGFVITEMTKEYMNLNTPKLKTSDITNCILFILSTPQNVNITELTVEPTAEFVGRQTSLSSN